MVICLEQGADLHMPQLMPLPLTVSCFSKIQIGFTFLVPAHQGNPGKRAVKWVCVYVVSGHVAERTNLRYFLVVGMCLSGLFTALFGLGRYWHIHSLSFYIGVQVTLHFCFRFLSFCTLNTELTEILLTLLRAQIYRHDEF